MASPNEAVWRPRMAEVVAQSVDAFGAFSHWMAAADAMLNDKVEVGDISDDSYGGPESPLAPLHRDLKQKWAQSVQARAVWHSQFDDKTVQKEKTGRLAFGLEATRAAQACLGVAWLGRVAMFQQDFRFGRQAVELITPAMSDGLGLLQRAEHFAQPVIMRRGASLWTEALAAKRMYLQRNDQFKPLWDRLEIYLPWLSGEQDSRPSDPHDLF